MALGNTCPVRGDRFLSLDFKCRIKTQQHPQQKVGLNFKFRIKSLTFISDSNSSNGLCFWTSNLKFKIKANPVLIEDSFSSKALISQDED
jgi:hypothetical protein